jgi:hypothetical protein
MAKDAKETIWKRLRRLSSQDDKENIDPVFEQHKAICVDAMNQSTQKRQEIVEKILNATMDKLVKVEGGKLPVLSLTKDYEKYITGIAYIIHKELGTKNSEELARIKEMIVDKVHWKRDSFSGALTPTEEWKLSKKDFKEAVYSAISQVAVQAKPAHGPLKEAEKPAPNPSRENLKM